MSGLKYRADIDGLRAVAVGAVVLFHLGVPGVPGGFSGVDVFFVISGYLVGAIIYKDIASRNFSLLSFYERRIRRLLPALVVVLACTLALGFVILLPTDYRDLGRSMVCALAFVSNIYFWATSNYFDGPAHLKPLLHTWSLAVEEQFYILFPPMLWLLNRLAGRRLYLILILLSLASFGYSAWSSIYDATAAFYSPLSRAWELSLGCLLALRPLPSLSRRVREIVTAIGLVLIVGGVVMLTEQSAFPGFGALAPTLGTALIIWSGGERAGTATHWLLSTPPLVFLGRCSYSLYLWHWPILVFARYYALRPLTPLELALVGGASLVLAAGSLYLVEKPFRTRILGRGIFVLAGGAMAALGMMAFAVHMADGFPARFAKVALPSGREIYTKCLVDSPEALRKWDIGRCSYPATTGGATVALWGDSFAGHYVPGLLSLRASNKFGLVQLTAAGCPPFVGHDEPHRPICKAFNDRVLEWIKTNRPQVVILSLRWNRYANPTKAVEEFNGTVRYLKALGIPSVLVGESPVFAAPVPQIAEIYGQRGIALDRAQPINAFAADKHLATMVDASRVQLFTPSAWLCNRAGCLFTANGRVLFDDEGHLSVDGSTLLAQRLWPQISLAISQGQARSSKGTK